jgi:hypothetical protein
MPVTAKLSRKFYDQFGDEIANELVEWFNKVDETYRTELRELNELNYARFDAKLEQRIAELRSDLRSEIGALGDKLGERTTALELRVASERVSLIRWMVGLCAAQITIFVGTVLVVLRGGWS